MKNNSNQHKNGMSRRKFLGTASCAALGSTTMLSSILNLGVINSLAGMSLPTYKEDNTYKALICILLAGGNDSYNMLVPRNGAHYTEYATTRSNLALAQGDLLPINYTDPNGRQFGLHPSMPEVQSLFNSNKMAFVSNVGTLVEPTTMAQYQNGGVSTPLGLFSHSDQIQQWQTSIPQTRSAIGWGGRIADILHAGNGNQNISMNITLSGTNVFQIGNNVTEYAIRASAGGSVGISVYDSTNPVDAFLKTGVESLLNQQYNDIFRSTYANKIKNSQSYHEQFNLALAGVPPLNTTFSPSYMSKNMELIAKTIAARNTINVNRQTFFVTFGGWDHHDNLIDNQDDMLGVLSTAIGELELALQELGVFNDVTTFTISDFARSLTSNGNGSDHAWGGNTMVMGGAVNGGQVYGSYPSLAYGGANDVGGAIMLPTTAVDEYFAELSEWFGISASDLPYILPNIGNFYTPGTGGPIGFMNI